jgi:hypothetical protein
MLPQRDRSEGAGLIDANRGIGRAKNRESEHGAIRGFHLKADFTADRGMVRLRM